MLLFLLCAGRTSTIVFVPFLSLSLFQCDSVPTELLNKAKTRLVFALCQMGKEDEADKVRDNY